MHPNPRRVGPVVLIMLLLAAAWWWRSTRAAASVGNLFGTGTIEATEVIVAAEGGGRVLAVEAEAGEAVSAGQPLVRFDDALLVAQRRQLEAALAGARGGQQAAEAGRAAAEASLALLWAGAPPEQLELARASVARAEAALEGVASSYDALPDAARAAAQGQGLSQQVTLAEATLDSARAQQALLEAGPRPQQLDAAEAQLDAAEAQVEAARAQVDAAEGALAVLEVQRGRLEIVAPTAGVVLSRAIEPGEVAVPGAALLTLADLGRLTLTVYLPEERYGQITLGESATVRVDSYPNEAFNATVRRIADRAEFTPRNVQTADGRRTTVYAVELSLPNPSGKLKPGMTADVSFDRGE